MGALPLVAVPHPLAGNDAGLVRAKAAGVIETVVTALTDDADAVAAAHRGSFATLTERRLAAGAVCVDATCAIDPALTAPAPK